MLYQPSDTASQPRCAKCDSPATAWVLPGRFYVCSHHRLNLGDWEWELVVPLDQIAELDLCPICEAGVVSRNGVCERCQWGVDGGP